MTTSFWLYAGLTFVTAFIGGILPVFFSFKERYLRIIVSLGAGLLLGMSLNHMLPEAAELIPEEFGAFFLIGFVLLMLLERFVMIHSCEEHGCDYHTIGLAAFAGLAVHAVIEGLALASTLVALDIGPLILLAVLVHKAPAALTLTSLLKLGGKSKSQIVKFITGIALATPAGMLLATNFFSHEMVSRTAGILLSLSGGTFLYIASCDLIPELHRSNFDKYPRLFAFLAGLGVSFFELH
ncbi:MAG: ZIP family metal transporter [Bdellovibrionaceae bacterium]|nr:ZIP family metal transporter [Bdellovibrionales bacterium]MCB9254798.1 ZIP family metal transporter [Pseudobdellovibrionaceae bacterium]